MMCTLPIVAGTTMLAPLFCLGEMNRSYNIYELTPQDMVRKANNFSHFIDLIFTNLNSFLEATIGKREITELLLLHLLQ